MYVKFLEISLYRGLAKLELQNNKFGGTILTLKKCRMHNIYSNLNYTLIVT